MGIINILDENLINKIAAGEVIERPASIVKELIDNSIDAAATEISVFIENAGKKKIAVIDNGCGMDEDDIFLSIERHATSKIKKSDDLFNISTHGFRGEALASIAAVSKFTIRSKQEKQNEGIELIIKGGVIKTKNIIGMPRGSEIIVEDLFFNTPVRKKFLKNDATETAHLLTAVTNHALAYPNIYFKFFNDNRIFFESPNTASRFEALLNFYGYSIKEDIIKIKKNIGDIAVEAYLGSPVIARRSRDRQKIYVNNRCIKNASVNAAVYNSYKTLLGVGEHPQYTVFIDLPADSVDVNIHPAKNEVRFTNAAYIQSALESLFAEYLNVSKRINPNISLKTFSVAELKKEEETDVRQTAAFNLEKVNPVFDKNTLQSNLDLIAEKKYSQHTSAQHPENYNFKNSITAELEKNYKIIGQVNNLYIIIECADGIKIIDQHAAHERVLYNKFMNIIKAQDKVEAQLLLLPVTIELTQAEKMIISQWLPVFDKIGMRMEDFGTGTLLLRSAPVFIGSRADDKRMILDLIDDIISLGKMNSIDEMLHNIIALMACKAAVKAGSKLLPSEMSEIAEYILSDKEINTCPHGRPTFINLNFVELEKTFKRRK